jgi:hypothetical protein
MSISFGGFLQEMDEEEVPVSEPVGFGDDADPVELPSQEDIDMFIEVVKTLAANDTPDLAMEAWVARAERLLDEMEASPGDSVTAEEIAAMFELFVNHKTDGAASFGAFFDASSATLTMARDLAPSVFKATNRAIDGTSIWMVGALKLRINSVIVRASLLLAIAIMQSYAVYAMAENLKTQAYSIAYYKTASVFLGFLGAAAACCGPRGEEISKYLIYAG